MTKEKKKKPDERLLIRLNHTMVSLREAKKKKTHFRQNSIKLATYLQLIRH